jgi:hypothetical protein
MKKHAVLDRKPQNKQLQRTVTRHHGGAASAPFHYALAARFTRQRAAAELRRYAPVINGNAA